MEEKRKISQERRRNKSNERRVTINESYSTVVKRKRTPGVQIKSRTEEELHYSTNEEPKPQMKPRIRNRKQTKSNDDLMSKMAIVICHAHFHRLTNGG